MIVRELIAALPSVTASGPPDTEIAALTASSREAAPGVMFAAIRGTSINGHQFIGAALAAGVAAVLAETAPPPDIPDGVAWLHVPDSRFALAKLAAVFYGNPWRDMVMAGITGTNGKTTTAFLIHHVMKTVWHRAGLLGTVRVDDGETSSPARHTTPGSIELSALLQTMRDHGCRGVAMEVSSHGIHQHRVSGVAFDACVFTNLTQDHLDYHGTIEEYFQAKAAWFHALAADGMGKKPVAVINVDDAWGGDLAKALEGRMPVLRFGLGVRCELRAGSLRQTARGMEFDITFKGRSYLVRAPLIGRFNVYNLLAALGVACACGIRLREAVAAVATAPQVPGRMEYVGNAGGAHVFVDYAHSPDAVENACRTLRELNPRRLLTVFGCGGDRDRAKRPLMAAAAARHSDACIVTSDNPRSEDPQAIIREIETGLRGVGHRSIVDRAEAIAYTIQHALSGDIVLIAGKGHETTQQFADHAIDFDDRKHASKALRDRAQIISESR